MEKITKVLLITTQSEFGGAQRYVLDVARHLPTAAFEVAVVAGGNGTLFELCKLADIPGVRLPSLVRPIRPWTDIRAIRDLYKLFRRLRPDVVHLNSSKAGVVGSIAGWLARVPTIIYTAHGFVFNEPLPGWQKSFYRIAERYTSPFKSRIICVSEADRQTGLRQRIASEKKLITIHNGIPPVTPLLTREQARVALGLPLDLQIVGTVANFYPTKGLEYLIDAARLVLNQHKNVAFTIIGEGALRRVLEKKIQRLNVQDRVALFSQTSGEISLDYQAASLLKAFDVFVLPSVKEGLPYTIIEAMAAGVPVIASDVGGIPELIRHQVNGLLTPPALPAPLSNAILTLLGNSELRATFAKRSRERFEHELRIEHMMQQTLRVYRGEL